jgi:hypothetical protein
MRSATGDGYSEWAFAEKTQNSTEGTNGGLRACWKDVEKAKAEAELAYLRVQIFNQPDLVVSA